MKKMVFRILFPALLLGLLCLSAQADIVTYQVTVNTSGQGGNYGYIDLQLNQGTLLPAQPVTASITNFAGGILNPADVNNDSIGASGDLATTLTIPADTSTDYFEGLTFGNSISFDITLSGAGVNLAGLAGGASGTTFVLGFSDSAFNPLFTNDESNATGQINIANDGTVSVDAFPDSSGGQPLADFVATPEPGTLSLFACAGLALLLFRRRLAGMVIR
jgi:hypothetical protein